MAGFEGKTSKELENFIEACRADYGGFLKVNLYRGNDDHGNSEGIWAACASPEDRAVYEDEKGCGQRFKVYLCNQPIDNWHDAGWGCPVIVTTFGEARPCAFENDQKAVRAEVEQINALPESPKESVS